MTRFFCLAVAFMVGPGCAMRGPSLKDAVTGPNASTTALYRNPIAQDKIFVEAVLSDGKPRLFLVDTGAAISVVSRRVAIELNLAIQARPGHLSGIGGSTTWVGSVLPSIQIGRFRISDTAVAVGVTGVPTHVGMVPLDGIIGSDILKHFRVEVDYPAQTLTLKRPGVEAMPPESVPLFFNGEHPLTQTTLTARDINGTTVHQPVLLEIDTGARGILLIGGTNSDLATVASQGTELIAGIGSSGKANKRSTRRIPVAQISVGGQMLDTPQQAVWIQYDAPVRRHSPEMPGLIGYNALKNHRLVLDYPDKRFALVAGATARPALDVHSWFIDRGEAKSDPLKRVRALFIIGQDQEARRRLNRLAQRPTVNPGAAALLSRIERREGKIVSAAQRLASLSIRDLIETGELSTSVNGLWLSGKTAEAETQARAATILDPASPAAWVALADVKLATGLPKDARHAIAEAVQLEANPHAHLLRRALIAGMDDDTDGALAHLRRLIRLNPADGYAAWLYARLPADPERIAMARADILNTEKSLHPGDEPLDFLAGAWHMLGDQQRAEDLMLSGLERDCSRASTTPSKENCQAWYQAMIGAGLPEAYQRVTGALQAHPGRAEFLDTLSVVLEAQGDLQGARDASWLAAARSPDDPYLVSQAIRLQAMVDPR